MSTPRSLRFQNLDFETTVKACCKKHLLFESCKDRKVSRITTSRTAGSTRCNSIRYYGRQVKDYDSITLQIEMDEKEPFT